MFLMSWQRHETANRLQADGPLMLLEIECAEKLRQVEIWAIGIDWRPRKVVRARKIVATLVEIGTRSHPRERLDVMTEKCLASNFHIQLPIQLIARALLETLIAKRFAIRNS